jgi:shikimate O-hydroxycinnamoyltransferase
MLVLIAPVCRRRRKRRRRRRSMASEVQVVESSFVTPGAAIPRKGLWVSSLDLDRANRGYTPTVYFYRSTDAAAAGNVFDVTSRLKESMAKALVLFYPLAGRLDVDKDGRIEINCNNERALFVVARSKLTMDDLKDLEPSPELTRLFVPSTEPSSIILAVQVSFTLSQEFYRIQSNVLTFYFHVYF